MIVGFSGHELLHSNADKGGNKVLIESNAKFREWNQLDIELYDEYGEWGHLVCAMESKYQQYNERMNLY